jgi:carboxypeptidase T
MQHFKKLYTLLTLTIMSLVLLGNSGSNSDNTSKNTNPKHSLVKVFANGEQDMKRIMREGLFFDHTDHMDGGYFESWISADELEMLRKSGVSHEIVIDDFEAYYNSLPQMTDAEISLALEKSATDFNVSHNIYGTMGGYLTFDQVINKLDSMRIEYPGLISAKFSIGNSVENKPQWTVRVSNSPNAPTGRPEVWFHSLIHAREPESMMQNIYFMYWLFENYNTDPIATYILENRELYFTPVINPDGYEYNRSTNPNGGGMWRKNRKLNSGTTYGVDLNRNFGTYEFWNSTNNGSSTSPSSDTYRGVAPFSEIETANMMNFVNSRNFKGILSYHTYGNYLIRPWGYVDAPTPDEPVFQEFSQEMLIDNHFTMGRSNQTVAYGVRGVTDDWYYNDSGHASAIAFTPEVGSSSDGFWPTQSRILPLAQSTVRQNIHFALAAGPYVAPNSINLSKENYVPGEQGTIKMKFRNKGLMNASNVRIELTAGQQLSLQTNLFSYPNIASLTGDSITVNFTLATVIPNNSAVKVNLKIKQDNDKVVHTQDFYVPVGTGNVLVLDSAENGMGRWTISTGWNVTTSQSYSPNNSFADSPTGNYSNSTNRTMTLTAAQNVTAAPVVFLSYWYKHNIDAFDNAYVDISSDNGTSWRSKKFFSGANNTWTRDVLDLSELANASSTMKLRFSLVSNGTIPADGIYLDNIRLVNYTLAPTGINPLQSELPADYYLSQNYPNPFNPSTSISFQLPDAGNVSLKLFDVLGKEVMTLVNEYRAPGSYEVRLDASNLAGGMYFYKLVSGSFSETKKMILVK